MMMSSSAASFSHEERIVIAPLANSATVRLEATSSLFQPHANRTSPTTPFPHVVKQLVEDYGVSRVLLQTGSISSSSYHPEDPLDDQLSAGPSGVSVLVEMRRMPYYRCLYHISYSMSSFKECPVMNKSQLTTIVHVQTEESLSRTAEKNGLLRPPLTIETLIPS
jgi:hypothetical protein